MMKKLPDGDSSLEDFRAFYDVSFIITDLDGTLIKGAEPVLKQIRDKISCIQKKKIFLTVATGRTYFGAKKLIKEIGVKAGMPIALYNGGVVLEYGTGNVLYSNGLSKATIRTILDFIEDWKGRAFFYSFHARSNGLDDCMDIMEKVYGIGEPDRSLDVNGLPISYTGADEIYEREIMAVLIDKSSISDAEMKEGMDLFKREKIAFTDSGNGFVEIKSIGMSKGIILHILKQRKDLKDGKMLAIGDNDNDIELFDEADISVAVADASIVALEHAEYICEHESAEGFLDMLDVIIRSLTYFGGK